MKADLTQGVTPPPEDLRPAADLLHQAGCTIAAVTRIHGGGAAVSTAGNFLLPCNGGGLTFMDIHIPEFLQRFSLFFRLEGDSCIEYFLRRAGSHDVSSRSLILSFDRFSRCLNISKFYPEIYREPLSRYLSAVCFYLMVHHAARRFHVAGQAGVVLETRLEVFNDFYSKLLDFHFSVANRRTVDNCALRGWFLESGVDTGMIAEFDGCVEE